LPETADDNLFQKNLNLTDGLRSALTENAKLKSKIKAANSKA